MEEQKEEKKTIYNTSYKSIFARNFVAGFAKGLGIIIVYIFLGGIIYFLAITYIMPRVNSFLADTIPIFESLIETGQDIQDTQHQIDLSPEQINRITEIIE